MTLVQDIQAPLRILIYALGGEGGGVLMNWVVAAARKAGHQVQATSVPGVAQRTGSTTYYIEIAQSGTQPVFNLVPMPGRVDILVASELVEAGRALQAGFVSPDLTTLISSTSRTFTTAEKIDMGDGRYDGDRVIAAAEGMAKQADLRDFNAMAEEQGTYISAVLFGAMAKALPWPVDLSRSVVNGAASLTGYDRAAEIDTISDPKSVADFGADGEQDDNTAGVFIAPDLGMSAHVREIVNLGYGRCQDYQDDEYAQHYLNRVTALVGGAGGDTPEIDHALGEAARRLALWMCYEDVARVAELKTRPERFTRIRTEAQASPDQMVRISEYLKPRLEEIADIMPVGLGQRLMSRAEAGKSLPFLGKGRHVHSTGVIGFWTLRFVAWLGRFRRKSMRFAVEQAEIDDWLKVLGAALAKSPAFAGALAELPRVRKGYSDTAQRGLLAYRNIMEHVVHPATKAGNEAQKAALLRQAIAAAMADESHAALEKLLAAQG